MSAPNGLTKEKLDGVDRLLANDRFDEAIALCGEIISADATCYMAYSKRGDILYSAGRHHDAFFDIAKLVELRPNCPSAYYVRAKWNLELGNYEMAINDANVVISSGEEYFINMAYFFRSISQLNLGNTKAAKEDCLRLPDGFKTAVTTRNTGWKVLSRDDLMGMIGA